MRSPGINGEGGLRGQPANPGSPGKWLLKWSVCVLQFCYYMVTVYTLQLTLYFNLNSLHIYLAYVCHSVLLFACMVVMADKYDTGGQ